MTSSDFSGVDEEEDEAGEAEAAATADDGETGGCIGGAGGLGIAESDDEELLVGAFTPLIKL